MQEVRISEETSILIGELQSIVVDRLLCACGKAYFVPINKPGPRPKACPLCTEKRISGYMKQYLKDYRAFHKRSQVGTPLSDTRVQEGHVVAYALLTRRSHQNTGCD